MRQRQKYWICQAPPPIPTSLISSELDQLHRLSFDCHLKKEYYDLEVKTIIMGVKN